MNLTKQKTELLKELKPEIERELGFCVEWKGDNEKYDASLTNDVLFIILKLVDEALDTIASAAREEAIKNAIKSLPEELGYDDYDKHIHSYVHENRGKCEICGLSWKMAGQYELYNNGIIACKKVLRSHLKEKQK